MRLLWARLKSCPPVASGFHSRWRAAGPFVKIRLSDGQQTCLLSLDWSLAHHTSAADNSGWVFVDTYAPSDPAPIISAWQAYCNELLQVKLDGTEVRRLAHHRSRPFNGYNYQPRVSSSRDGTRLVFNSNFGLQSILGYPTEYSDVYLIAGLTGGGTTPRPDTTPPTISNVAAAGITATSATITWATNEAPDGMVTYGPSASYGNSSALNPAPVTSHSQLRTANSFLLGKLRTPKGSTRDWPFAQRPKGPTVSRPGREAGIRLGKNYERRRRGTRGVPVLRTSNYGVSESPPSRAGLFTAGPSALAKRRRWRRKDPEGVQQLA